MRKYSRISPTAIFCARMRAKQDLPFANKVIELLDSKYSNYIEDLPDYGNALSSTLDYIPFIVGRYYSLNDVLTKIKNAFIVELASGLSPRSLDFLNRVDIIYIETELERLIKLKKQILKDIINKNSSDDSNLFFASINPLKQKDMDKIGHLYLEKGNGKRLIIVHEGLLMYLDKNEKKLFRNNIKYLFENYARNGLWLSSDFSRIIKSSGGLTGKENIRVKISKITKKAFDYFKSKEEINNFLISANFNYEIISNKKIINLLITKKSLQFNKKVILKSAESYRIWKIQLA